jgi:hypothetical protein
MVSEGELRAFRDENKMKFKREDVDNLKKGRITEPTIILPSTPGAGQDETVLDLDIQEEQASLAEAAGGADETAPPSTETDDLLLAPTADEEKAGETEETFIEEESDTGLTTEPLKLADEVEAAETVEAEPVTEEVEEARPTRQTGRRSRRMAAVAAGGEGEEEIEARRPSAAWTALLVVAFVFAGYSMFFAQDTMLMEAGRQEQPSGMTAGLARWTLNQFWGDPEWRRFHEREYPAEVQPPIKISDAWTAPEPEIYKGPSFHRPDVFVPKPAQ